MSSYILVIGSINMDFIINTQKFPAHADDEITGDSYKQMMGGKGANQAVAISRMGAEVIFSCNLGNDSFSKLLLNRLKEENINTDFVYIDQNKKTGTVFILVRPDGEHSLILVPGANASFKKEKIEMLEDTIKKADIILTQLEIPIESVRSIVKLANKYSVPVVLDAGPAQKVPLDYFKGVYILSPNESEASILTGININCDESRKKAAKKLLSNGVDNVVFKMGKNGALVADKNGFKTYPAFKIKSIDTTGAGDAFTAALTYIVSKRKKLHEAIKFANAAGALAVSKAGTTESLPTKKQIEEFIGLRNEVLK